MFILLNFILFINDTCDNLFFKSQKKKIIKKYKNRKI